MIVKNWGGTEKNAENHINRINVKNSGGQDVRYLAILYVGTEFILQIKNLLQKGEKH